MNTPQKSDKYSGMFYCVVEAEYLGTDAAMKDIRGVFSKVVVKAKDKIDAEARVRDAFCELNLRVTSLVDFISLQEFENSFEIDAEMKRILSFVTDKNDVSYGDFHAYE